MSNHEEEARIAAAVQQQVKAIMATQQAQFSTMMEKAMKDALKGLEQTNALLLQQREAALKELDALREERAKAEREGDKMAQEYFEGRQRQFVEAAKTELLRDLTREHLLAGKTPHEIAQWLNVPLSFSQNIQKLLLNIQKFKGQKPVRSAHAWGQRLRYADYGRGGTIYYESTEGDFDMWWEFGGGNAVVIVDIPSLEQWEARTKLPLSKRAEVLQFIGEQIIADKMSSSNASFVIGDNVITFYAD